MLKYKIASFVLASIIAIGCTGVTAFAANTPGSRGESSLNEHGNKAASYMALTDEERAELKSQIFAKLTDEQKTALIDKMGTGKGGALGQNSKGGKAKAFESMTDEERAELKSKIFANLTEEQKAALIEKIGSGKGGALGQNVKGGKSKAFQSMTDEEKVLIRPERYSNKTIEQ